MVWYWSHVLEESFSDTLSDPDLFKLTLRLYPPLQVYPQLLTNWSYRLEHTQFSSHGDYLSIGVKIKLYVIDTKTAIAPHQMVVAPMSSHGDYLSIGVQMIKIGPKLKKNVIAHQLGVSRKQ